MDSVIMDGVIAEQPVNWRETRRIRAWELVRKGSKQADVAEALGVTPGVVSQWGRTARREGPQALRHRKPTGSPSKLNRRQLRQLSRLLAQGPAAFGFSGEIWTRQRVAQVIKEQFGVSCHPAHLGRMLKSCGFSRQKPALRAPATVGGRGGHPGLAGAALPATEKKALAGGRTILWADGSGFYLLPALLRAWAPAARTPVIRRKPAYEHLSAISSISITGELYPAAQDHSYKGPDAIRFLEQLLREIPGKLLLIWDGATAHRSRAVKEWLSQGASRRIRLEQLPGYAPELNPDEGVWRCLKRVELRNLVCADLGQLAREFWNAAKRLLGKPEVLRPCIKEVSYVW